MLPELHADLFSRHSSPLEAYVLWRSTKYVNMLCPTSFVVDATENSTAVWPRVWVTKARELGKYVGRILILMVDGMGERKEKKKQHQETRSSSSWYHHHDAINTMTPCHCFTDRGCKHYPTSSLIQRGSVLNWTKEHQLGCDLWLVISVLVVLTL